MIKSCVVLDGVIINVGEMDKMPEGAVIEEREMEYSEDYGWREKGWVPPLSEVELLNETNNLLTTELAKVKIDLMLLKGGAS